MGLNARLLAGLAVLVFVAIASTGWLTLAVARGGLEVAEEERARALGGQAAGLLGAMNQSGEAGRSRMMEAARTLRGVGGVTDVTLVDAMQQTVFGEPDHDAGLSAALAGAGTLLRRSKDVVSVYAPVRGREGSVVGALRLRMSVGATLGEALRGSTSILLALTLVDGGLVLLFGALFLRSVIRPLEALSKAAQRVGQGDFEVGPIADPGPGEVAQLSTAFYRMTSALREQQRSLEASREQILAQEKLATVGRLAAGVAHEVGNPLTAVLGFVELLLSEAQSPAARDLLVRVKSETERIHGIVHELLDYARPVGEALEPVRIDEAIEMALDLLRPQPRLRGVVIETALPPTLPPVAASTRRLLQVMLNLLWNAADAMGGAGTVRISALLDDKPGADPMVQVDVADSGPGVPATDRARIFDPFFTTKEPGAGSGLGLAVCRSIVSAFGGSIALAPSPSPSPTSGVGATFRITLPVWKSADAGQSATKIVS